MSYKLAVSLLLAIVMVVGIWFISLFVDINLARQLLLAFIIPSIVYLVMDYRTIVDKSK